MKSGVSTSIVVVGADLCSAAITSAKCPAPPSSRSSRSTDVTTTWPRPSLPTASAMLAGSCGLSAPGLPVATLQKPQARVQVSPMIMKVACLCFQHSPMFGHAASSHTVVRPYWRISRLVSAYSGELGARTRIQSGLRGIGLSGRCAFSGWRSARLSGVLSSEPSMALDMERPAIGRQYRLVHHLRQGWMREHGGHELGFGGLQRLGDAVALDQLSHFRTDHVGTEQLAGLGVEDRLDETLGLAERDRFAVADEGELADLELQTLRLSRRLGHADAGDLRLAVGAAGDVLGLHRMHAFDAGDLLDHQHALVHRLVREPRRA